ncbi:MAG TPA: glycosyltransferase family 8 protein [Clostridiales bacterium]|nr:glycosyltransferase family 8 protein [Clostridiales bacterium]
MEKGRKMEQNQSLCIAYAADDGYAKYLGISMLSLFQSNKDFAEIAVFVLDCGIGEANRAKLKSIAGKYHRAIYFISMEVAVSGLSLHMGSRKIAVASYARLFLASIMPQACERVLYLDCDTIVRGSLMDFWNTDLEGYMVAGVRDTVDSFYLKKIGLEQGEYYVNAGVLLVNLAGWRDQRLEKRFMDFIRKFNGNVPHHDQGTINGVCRRKKYIVAPSYNAFSNIYSFPSKTIKRVYFMEDYYSQKELDRAKKAPVILHFTTGLEGRPWEENCTHPMRGEYLRAAKASPWRDDPLLPDSRKLSLKAFSCFYKHVPLFLSETAYRCIGLLAHIRD